MRATNLADTLRPHQKPHCSSLAAAYHSEDAALVVVRVLVEVPEVHEDGKADQQGFVLGVLDAAELHLEVVDVRREEELAAAGDLLLEVPHLVAGVGVSHGEVDLRAGAAGQRAAEAPLAAAAVGLEHRAVTGVADREREVTAGPGVLDGADLLARRHVRHLDHGPVEAAARASEVALHVEGLHVGAPLGVEDIKVPGRTVGAALLELAGAEVGPLHGVQDLMLVFALPGQDAVPVGHLKLLAEERRGGLQQAGLLLDLHGGEPLQALECRGHRDLRGRGAIGLGAGSEGLGLRHGRLAGRGFLERS
mmetsp:Transcript_34220/g.97803  ORF Transcript_34220/g.97803 Transcript_34220/m.97803 type:complete len:307 (+) Transcript_34220:168-1088(+)